MLRSNSNRRRRVSAWSLYVIIAMSLCAVRGLAQSATFTRTDYPLLGNNHIAADFNGDGKIDLAGAGGQFASVMIGNGDGTFQPKVQYPVASWSQALAAGDFNSDGRLDLVVTINDPQIGLSLLLGNGNGAFGAPVNFPNTSGFDAPSVVATDLNNDGKLDVVIMHSIACFTAPCRAAETISVMLGNGDGTFQPTRELAAAQHMHCMTAGDFNRDGIKDLAIGSENTKLHILFGVGDGTFVPQPEMTLIPGGDLFAACNDVDVADFNRDTIQDLVVPLGNGYGNVVLLGNGDGTFRQSFRITENAVYSPLNLAVADFNRDGLQDIARAMGDGTFGLMEIANGNGDGTFQAPVRYLKPPNQSSIGGVFIAASDLNGDGKPDIALVVGGASPGLAVLINTTGGSSPPLAYGSLTVTPSSVTGGTAATVRISLATGTVAPAGGLQFAVSSSNTAAVTVPATVSMPAGNSSVSFSATTRSVTATQTVTIQVTNNQLGSRTVTLSVTPPPPSAVTLSTLTLNPTTVTGGNSAQGTVRLSASAATATVINLTSSSASASVPVSVTVPAGASSANFTIGTTTVTSSASATISATLNATTRTATLTINPAAADTVTITRAEYDASKRELRVEATSTRSNATLQVFVTSSGQLIGTLTNNGGGKYGRQFNLSTNPQNITVRSNFGGAATRTVVAR